MTGRARRGGCARPKRRTLTTMKITIKKTIGIPEIPGDVEMEGGTLKDVLDLIFRDSYFRKEIVDPRTGEWSLEGLFRVSLNDVPSHSLPGRF